MKRIILIGIGLIMSLSLIHAQSVSTIFMTEDTEDGEKVVGVRYKEKEYDFQMDTFAQADQNGDGCVDKREAHEKGILNFARHAKISPKCLNEDEYLRAMHGEE